MESALCICGKERYAYTTLWEKKLSQFCVCNIKRIQWGFYRNVISMRWDCGKPPILSSVYLTGSHRIFTSQWPSSTNCEGTATLYRSGPLQEHETFSKEHMVHEYISKTCTRCSFDKVPCSWRGPDLWSVAVPSQLVEEGHCDGKMRWDPVR